MSEEDSILAKHVAQRRRSPLANAALSETAAIALDASAMIAYVAPLFELVCDTPAIKDSPNGPAIKSLVEELKKRSDAHINAMAELNRGR
jgi:hypothetical protein